MGIFYKGDDVVLHVGDCISVMKEIPDSTVDMIFADPPYFLSNGGISCRAGKMVSVNKAEWDESKGFDSDFAFTLNWIRECQRILAENGSIWISGTMHNIYQVGFILQKLSFKILNEISWYKPNAPPNLSCRYFAHSHETVLWARKLPEKPHHFNYELMKQWDDTITPTGKQMRSVWHIPITPQREKKNGKHPTQKPVELLRRIICSSTPKGATVLDPFNGSGTTGVVAKEEGRNYIGIEKDEGYLKLSMKRMGISRLHEEMVKV